MVSHFEFESLLTSAHLLSQRRVPTPHTHRNPKNSQRDNAMTKSGYFLLGLLWVCLCTGRSSARPFNRKWPSSIRRAVRRLNTVPPSGLASRCFATFYSQARPGYWLDNADGHFWSYSICIAAVTSLWDVSTIIPGVAGSISLKGSRTATENDAHESKMKGISTNARIDGLATKIRVEEIISEIKVLRAKVERKMDQLATILYVTVGLVGFSIVLGIVDQP
jgi:hypothetical protein